MGFQVSLKWLKDYLSTLPPAEELAERLTLAGLEVEEIDHIGSQWDKDKLLVSQVKSVKAHPNADKLCLVEVSYGKGKLLTIVTGAANLKCYVEEALPESLFCPLALAGAEVFDPSTGEFKTLVPSEIRGVMSEAMLCSEKELGIGEDHEGIMILGDDAVAGQSLYDYLCDDIIHLDIKGGFSHLLGMVGIAREVSALFHTPLNRFALQSPLLQQGTITDTPSFASIQIANSAHCSRYSAILIQGTSIVDSPFWLQQRLIKAGMRPRNLIVDVTNYVMLELGQPLHAFDYQLLCQRASNGTPQIQIRFAQEGEAFETLDDVQRTLSGQMLMIADEQGSIAIAGVMGGAGTEITEETQDILIESANFEFLNNRQTAQTLKLHTEAAERFGKDLDPSMTLQAALRAAELIVKYGGGTVCQEYGDVYPNPKPTKSIELQHAYLCKLLGVHLNLAEITDILHRLEFQTQVTQGDNLLVSVPEHRMDIHEPADLVEEIIRVYGYHCMKPTLMNDELPPQLHHHKYWQTETLRDLLCNAGFDEIITYSIVGVDEENALFVEPRQTDYLTLQNPLSSEKNVMRQTLLVGALTTIKEHLKHESASWVFEVGNIFLPNPEGLPTELPKLCVAMSGKEEQGWYQQNQRILDFYDFKGSLEVLFDGFQISVQWKKTTDARLHTGKSASLWIGDVQIGIAGELHPKIQKRFGLTQSVCIADLDVATFFKCLPQERAIQPICIFEPIYEDLAFVVDESVESETICNLMKQLGQPLLQEVKLFDVFRGEKVGAGKKSLAFALTYQSMNHVLCDDDVAPLREKIIATLQDHQAFLRV